MATLETQQLDEIIVSTRRKMLTKGGAALAALAFGAITPKRAEAQAVIGDTDILNFALNLEYLEAQFYNLAVYGVTIDKLPTPIPISVNGTHRWNRHAEPNLRQSPVRASLRSGLRDGDGNRRRQARQFSSRRSLHQGSLDAQHRPV